MGISAQASSLNGINAIAIPPWHDPERRDRDRQKVGRETEMGNTSEVVERKDAGRQTGDECGQPNPGEIEHYFPPPTATGPVATSR